MSEFSKAFTKAMNHMRISKSICAGYFGVTEDEVKGWLNGEDHPDEAYWAKLEKEFGIPHGMIMESLRDQRQASRMLCGECVKWRGGARRDRDHLRRGMCGKTGQMTERCDWCREVGA